MVVNSWYNGYSPQERDAKYKELKDYEKASKDGIEFELGALRSYTAQIGEEWFAKVSMDIESLADPKARSRG
jgi:hypothetical protein